ASIDYATISGSATGSATCGEAADYINGSGTLTWAAGEMGSKTGTISICNDAIQEPNEAFTLALANPNGVTLGTQNSVGVVINDDDDPGQVQFSVSNYSLGEANTTVSFTVTRTALDGPAVSIDYAADGGTATAGAGCGGGADYTNTSGTLSWAAGDISNRTVNLTFCNDWLAEGDETIHLNLTHPTGGVIPPANPALLITISDDDLFRQVTNTNDNGAGSLRQALADVSSVSPSGTGSINFAPGLAGTITLLTALPDITRNVRIEGPSAKLLSVKRSNEQSTPQFRIFTVGADSEVYLSGLTLANGRPNGSGGAISNEGTLDVENCSIESSAALFGGGVTNQGSMTLTNSTVVGNTSLFTGPGLGGGGIQNFGQLLIVGCTISGNSAAPGSGYGGGISNGPHAQLTIAYSTITANTAFGGSSPDYPDAGGGIFQLPFADHNPVIRGSIIAGNIAPTGPDLAGPFTSDDYNLIGSTQGATISGEIAHNLTNVDARLAPLADNGGQTRTHALLNGSPAIDKGDNREPPATDQRGLPRLSDGDSDGSALPDMGAFEVQSSCSIAFVTTSLPSATEGAIYGQQLEATGGTTPYSFTLTSGALPTGLSLSADGVIFGTVVAAGSFNFEVTVSDANGCFRRRTYTLVIDAAPACAIDVTSQLSMVRGGFRQNFATRRFIQTVTIKNMGTAAVAGPLSLMLDSLPGYVALYNRAGVTTCFRPLGNPYVNVPVGDDAVLTSGETVTLVLEFTNSNTQQSIVYVPHILAGPVR
ncbi:MAG: putative Ig domain-containing protein, partial [Pyrinomonadaceae bacterium]|nr:putative Ig domain-containing protein [Pyrinomonadaceae bacterium]